MQRLEYQFTADGRTWTLDYHTLTMDEWCAAERATGQHWAALATAIDTRSAIGLKTFYWLTRRREQPGLGFNDPMFSHLRPADLTFEVFADEEGKEGQDPPDLPEVSTSSASDFGPGPTTT